MLVLDRIARAADDGGAGGAAGTVSDAAPALDSTLLTAPPAGEATTAGADSVAGADTQAGADTVAGADTQAGADTVEAMKPEDYKLDLPEGIKADDPLLAAFLEGAAKGGLDPAAAQAVVSALGPKLVEQLAAPAKAWTALNEQWTAAVKAHPEIGGANHDAAVGRVLTAFNTVMQPAEVQELRAALNMTGAGNNPHVILAFHRMAELLTEKGAVQGNSPAEVRNPAALMYPTSNAAGAAKGA